MPSTLRGDVGVRCKPQSLSQSVQRRQLGFDGLSLAFEPRSGGIEGGSQNTAVGVRRERGQQLSDDRTAEPGREQLLYPQDETLMLRLVEAVAG
jgi:hypothetical protein